MKLFYPLEDNVYFIVLISGSSIAFFSLRNSFVPLLINFEELAPYISEFLGFLNPLPEDPIFFYNSGDDDRFWGERS